MKIYLPKYEAVVTVDDCDLPLFSAHNWYVSAKGNNRYVSRNENGKCIFLHREIMQRPSDMVVDHIDGNGLNNSRSANLRIVTHQQNLWNRPSHEGSIGIYFQQSRQKWRATMDHDGRKLELGAFDTEEMALAARDVASRLLRDATATQNDCGADYSSFSFVNFSPAARRVLLAAVG